MAKYSLLFLLSLFYFINVECTTYDISSQVTLLGNLFESIAEASTTDTVSEDNLHFDELFADDAKVCIDEVGCADVSLLLQFKTLCDNGGSSEFAENYVSGSQVFYETKVECANSQLGESFTLDAIGYIEFNEDGLVTEIVQNYKDASSLAKIQLFLGNLSD